MNTEDQLRQALHVTAEGVEPSAHLWRDIERSMVRPPLRVRSLVVLAAAAAMVIGAIGLVRVGRDSGNQQLRVSSLGSGLLRPTALAVAPDGSLLVADRGRSQVLRRTFDGKLVAVAGTGKAGFSGDGGSATSAQLDQPAGLAVARDGTVYVADTANNRIRRIAPDGAISTVAGSGHAGSSGDGGPALAADLNEPQAVALGPSGDLYLTDSRSVRRVGADGNITTAVGGAVPLVVDGRPVSFRPNAIAVVGSGDLYVASASSKELLRITPGGDISGVGTVSVATAGLVAAPDGGVVVADEGHFSIGYGNFQGGQGMPLTLTPIVTFTNGSVLGVSGTFRPSGVAVGPDGRIFASTDGANGGSPAPAVVEILADGSIRVLPIAS